MADNLSFQSLPTKIRIALVRGNALIKNYEFESNAPPKTYRVGADPSCEWAIRDANLAPFHCSLSWNGQSLWLLGEGHPIKADGVTIESSYRINKNGTLEVGDAAFEVTVMQSAKALEPSSAASTPAQAAAEPATRLADRGQLQHLVEQMKAAQAAQTPTPDASTPQAPPVSSEPLTRVSTSIRPAAPGSKIDILAQLAPSISQPSISQPSISLPPPNLSQPAPSQPTASAPATAEPIPAGQAPIQPTQATVVVDAPNAPNSTPQTPSTPAPNRTITQTRLVSSSPTAFSLPPTDAQAPSEPKSALFAPPPTAAATAAQTKLWQVRSLEAFVNHPQIATLKNLPPRTIFLLTLLLLGLVYLSVLFGSSSDEITHTAANTENKAPPEAANTKTQTTQAIPTPTAAPTTAPAPSPQTQATATLNKDTQAANLLIAGHYEQAIAVYKELAQSSPTQEVYQHIVLYLTREVRRRCKEANGGTPCP